MQDFNFNESKQRGTKEFPVEFHYVDQSHPQYVMPFHWHLDYEFVRVISGTFFITLDGEEHELNKEEFCFIPAGVLHGGIPVNCVYECIVFDIELLRCRNFAPDTFLRNLVHEKLRLETIYTKQKITSSECFAIASDLFSSLREKQWGYELKTIGAFYRLFGLMKANYLYSEQHEPNEKLHRRTDQLKSSIEYIEKAYSQPLSLNQLSLMAGMSPKYFCRIFKQLTHHTPIDYLNSYRIDRACALIAATDLSLTDICYQCGFNDFSYFIKTFKRYKHLTPKKYAAGEDLH